MERNSGNHYLILLDEAHERRPLNLDRLAMSIVKGDYEMEKIALPQITRRLFLEVRAAHANPEIILDTQHFTIVRFKFRLTYYKINVCSDIYNCIRTHSWSVTQ